MIFAKIFSTKIDKIPFFIYTYSRNYSIETNLEVTHTMNTKKNSFQTAFQVHLPQDLGFIENVSAHLQIGDKDLEVTKIWYVGRYISVTGNEWSKVFNDDNEEFRDYHTLKSHTFAFPIEIWDLIEGTFYLTFTATKDEVVTSYHTEKFFFRKSDKLVVYR